MLGCSVAWGPGLHATFLTRVLFLFLPRKNPRNVLKDSGPVNQASPGCLSHHATQGMVHKDFSQSHTHSLPFTAHAQAWQYCRLLWEGKRKDKSPSCGSLPSHKQWKKRSVEKHLTISQWLSKQALKKCISKNKKTLAESGTKGVNAKPSLSVPLNSFEQLHLA